MRYTRTLPTLNGVNDLEFSLNSYNWMSQWIREYFLSAALLQIGSVIISCSFFLIIISKLIIKDNFDKSFSFHDGYFIFNNTYYFLLVYKFQKQDMH